MHSWRRVNAAAVKM